MERRKGKAMTAKEKRARAATEDAHVREHERIVPRDGEIRLDPREEAEATAVFAAIGLAFVLIGAAL